MGPRWYWTLWTTGTGRGIGPAREGTDGSVDDGYRWGCIRGRHSRRVLLRWCRIADIAPGLERGTA
jgi:hypothetical protein